MKCKERPFLYGLIVFVFILIFTVLKRDPFVSNKADETLTDRLQAMHLAVNRRKLSKSNYTSDVFGPVADGERPNLSEPRHKKHKFQIEDVSNYVNYTDSDVDHMLHMLYNSSKKLFSFQELDQLLFSELVSRINGRIKKGRYLRAFAKNKRSSGENWEIFHKGIHQTALYDPIESNLEGLMKDLTFQPIVAAKMKDGGTQIKLVMTYRNGGKALFKPMRFPRDVETIPDHYYFNDYERHHSEIAAFHLDWVLGFYRVPPTIGRKINLTSEVIRVADKALAKKFFRSPVNNICFIGDCSYYCDSNHAVCGKPDIKEGSFAAFLPADDIADRITWRNPWRRSYSRNEMAYWEENDDICDYVRVEPPYDKGRRLLELIDMHIFDFLQGNMDRHHYETYTDFGNNTFYLHYDNGRGFGKTKHDELSILAPLYQCCQISYSTFITLVKLYRGPERLSELMRESLRKDSLNPILTEAHLYALDRRVIKILKEVYKCLTDGRDLHDVIVDRTWNV